MFVNIGILGSEITKVLYCYTLPKNFKLVKSTMTRATETANIILKHLPEDIQHSSCDLIREGPPCVPDPPATSWTESLGPHEFYQEGARIEAAFRRYFHRYFIRCHYF